jgi:hypothetical protein
MMSEYNIPQYLTNRLPIDAWLKGWRLIYDTVRYRTCGLFQLKDEHGNVMHEWNYSPSLAELDDVCNELYKKEENVKHRIVQIQ